MYINVLDHHAIEQTTDKFRLVFVVRTTQITLNVSVDAEHILHLLYVDRRNEVLQR